MGHVSLMFHRIAWATGLLWQGSSEEQPRASHSTKYFSLLALYLLISHWPSKSCGWWTGSGERGCKNRLHLLMGGLNPLVLVGHLPH